MEFTGKTAAIIGGGGGIGRELALMLSEAGVRVVLGDVDETAAKDVVAQGVAEMHAACNELRYR